MSLRLKLPQGKNTCGFLPLCIPFFPFDCGRERVDDYANRCFGTDSDGLLGGPALKNARDIRLSEIATHV
jgi:hypothetical protein